jgi:hypothetical protein
MIKNDGYKTADKKIIHEFLQNIQKFPAQSWKLFTDLIVINSKQPAYHLFTNAPDKNQLFKTITITQSNIVRILNIFSFCSFPLILLVIQKRTTHSTSDFVTVNLIASSVIFYTYIANGVTYWQGDRLLVPIYYISLVWCFYQLNTIIALSSKRPFPPITGTGRKEKKTALNHS